MDRSNKSSGTGKSTSLKIVRKFNVAPEVVFDAFTKPVAMRVWWTDDTEFDIDLRVDGQWTIKREENDMTLIMSGKYLEISRPHRLKYTISMPQFSPNHDIVSIDIMSDESGCIMTFIQTGKDISAELRELPEGTVSESEKGWQQGFDLMTEAWENSEK